MQASGLGAGSLILLTMMVEPGAAAEQQFTCKGQVVQENDQPGRSAQTDRSERDIGPKEQAIDDFGRRQNARSPHDEQHKIQLKFATKEFVGEYFHYTGDLFLIYRSGQLARLSCSPA
jgi:hypothetical protein